MRRQQRPQGREPRAESDRVRRVPAASPGGRLCRERQAQAEHHRPGPGEDGEVKASAPQSVPAIGDHPAGTGVLVEYTVTWPDSTTASRKAVRVVQQGDTWLVDQSEDIAESDEAHGNPVRDALMRG
ncbi:hypothetical protein SHKM778_95140 (plasmid) [Streptomyces sp. KM77-8]|uniref:Head-tail adaptor protein n=1 Tax=Streptomyces haneummycinicus TaxID=3074435 RepID=A0AAT9HZY6_9ACTN